MMRTNISELSSSLLNLSSLYLEDFLPEEVGQAGQELQGVFRLVLLVSYSTTCILGLVINMVLIGVIIGKMYVISGLVTYFLLLFTCSGMD